VPEQIPHLDSAGSTRVIDEGRRENSENDRDGLAKARGKHERQPLGLVASSASATTPAEMRNGFH
jgi:hypothetical protein